MTKIRKISFNRIATVNDELTMVERLGYDVGFKTLLVAPFVSSDGTVSKTRWDPVHRPTGTFLGRWFGTRAQAIAYLTDFVSWVGDSNLEADEELAKAAYNLNCSLVYNLVKAWPNGLLVMDAEPQVLLGRNETYATGAPAQHWCTEPFSPRKVQIDVQPGQIKITDLQPADAPALSSC